MSKNLLLNADHISVSYGGKPIVKDVSFSLHEGEWLMLIGPNGAGKTTLLNAVSQAVPHQGSVTLLGREARRIRSRKLARLMGTLTQNHYVGYGFTVEEVIRLGLYAHRKGLWERESTLPNDVSSDDRVREAAQLTGLTDLLSHSVLTLSGGELQRTFLAQLFVQDPRILLLDEPANHLDLIYQQQIFSLVSKWQSLPGRAVISVVHDLSLARKYGSHALLLDKGQTVSQGAIGEVMTPQNLDTVYSMDVRSWMQELYGQWKE